MGSYSYPRETTCALLRRVDRLDLPVGAWTIDGGVALDNDQRAAVAALRLPDMEAALARAVLVGKLGVDAYDAVLDRHFPSRERW